MSDDLKDRKPDEPPADPIPPAKGALSRALAWAASAIRKKNRAQRPAL
jgi:hypothetical protein